MSRGGVVVGCLLRDRFIVFNHLLGSFRSGVFSSRRSPRKIPKRTGRKERDVPTSIVIPSQYAAESEETEWWILEIIEMQGDINFNFALTTSSPWS